MRRTGQDTALLFLPIYTYAEAARLAFVKRGSKVKRWLEGYVYTYGDERRFSPPVTRHERVRDERALTQVSFIDLVEVALVHQLLRHGISLRLIKRAMEYCQDKFGVERPLVTLDFKLGGKDIFVRLQEDQLVDVGRRPGQHAIEGALEPFLNQLEHDEAHRLAYAWWPMGKDQPVWINPEYGFGRPVIYGTGVPTEIIAEQHRAGASIGDIADDFDLTPQQVEAAIRYELLQRTA